MKSAAQEDVIPALDGPGSASEAASVADVPGLDRRLYSRRRDEQLNWIRTARLRTAGEVSLVDLSAGGALIDANVPLRPGAVLSLEIVGEDVETAVSLRVLRCHVAGLTAEGARYRGACQFAKPIELPGLHPIPDLRVAAHESFAGLDSALRRVVERAYAPDLSERLAVGDIVIVLQSLARHAAGADDQFGRQVGSLLEELLPLLRQRRGLHAALNVIERQLQLALPQARLRLVAEEGGHVDGTRSVLIAPPGKTTSAPAVSIDLPSTLAITDGQARLLRTSSRVITLIQRLDGHADDSTLNEQAQPSTQSRHARSLHLVGGTDAAQAPGTWQKIVVRYAEGQMLKGFTHDFHGSKSQFTLWPSINAAASERVVVPLARLKAVFFVREFGGDPDYVEQKGFDAAVPGRRIEVTLLDGEVLVGTTLNYRTDSTGFFMSPADPRANNLRVFVVSTAVRQVRFP